MWVYDFNKLSAAQFSPVKLGWNWSTTIVLVWDELPGPVELFGRSSDFTDQVGFHQLELGCRVAASIFLCFCSGQMEEQVTKGHANTW